MRHLGASRFAEAVNEVFAEPNCEIPASLAQRLVQIVRQRSGISVNPENQAFLHLRITRRARELDLALHEYLALCSGPIGDNEAQILVESLATHTTDFFREQAHYQKLERHILPDLVAQGAGREWPLTVWSAACSIGSELWSAGMVLGNLALQSLGGLRQDLRGTDISERVIRRAQAGIYSAAEIRGIPEHYRKTYLLRARDHLAKDAGQTTYRIAPHLRSLAQFHTYNLVRPAAHLGFTADVAFLRNVLIYFNPPDQVAALRSVASQLRAGGYLFLGHSETMPTKTKLFEQVGPATYRRTDHAL